MKDLTMIKITTDRVLFLYIIKEFSFVRYHFKRIIFFTEYPLTRH